jgi:hypothetical protein
MSTVEQFVRRAGDAGTKATAFLEFAKEVNAAVLEGEDREEMAAEAAFLDQREVVIAMTASGPPDDPRWAARLTEAVDGENELFDVWRQAVAEGKRRKDDCLTAIDAIRVVHRVAVAAPDRARNAKSPEAASDAAVESEIAANTAEDWLSDLCALRDGRREPEIEELRDGSWE